MPTTSPAALRSGPPELPGLMAQSVCRNSTRLSGMPTSALLRRRLLMMPSVKVLSSPNGFPTAITQSPTPKLFESPSFTDGRRAPTKSSLKRCAEPSESSSVIRTSARSAASSAPTIVPSYLAPFVKLTRTRLAPATTWLFVTTSPFRASQTKPEPWPLLSGSKLAWYCQGCIPREKNAGGLPAPLFLSCAGLFSSVSSLTTAGPTRLAAACTKLRDFFPRL
mmetsp:Transcript_1145/g.2772  ORF Transcript_1145/g.2772 Transcript_1145/m.2772 type:complete len:222 (+) Transcript_1145:429-1094(+)